MIPEVYSVPDVICQHCGNANDFHTIMKSNQNTAWCNGCDRFIKNIPQGNPPVLFFGKYKGRLIATLKSKEEVDYLIWLSKQPFCKGTQLTNIQNHLNKL